MPVFVFLLGIAAGGSAAEPRGNALTLYAAYRDGGSFTDITTDNDLPIEASSAGAVSLDLRLDANRQLQLYVSHQNSRVDARRATQPTPPVGPLPAKFPLAVTYAHIGGTVFFNKHNVEEGGYLVGGLGVTLFQPDLDGLANELRPSVNLGIGYQFPFGEDLALRIEARGYATFVNSSSALFCSGGCVVFVSSDTVTQGEVQLGLSYRY